MTEIRVDIDADNHDVLFCRRAEMFFVPNKDGTPSTNGKIIWHTEWWHYALGRLRGTSMGPQIERMVADVLAEDYPVADDEIPATVLIDAIKAAFVKHARADLGHANEPGSEE